MEEMFETCQILIFSPTVNVSNRSVFSHSAHFPATLPLCHKHRPPITTSQSHSSTSRPRPCSSSRPASRAPSRSQLAPPRSRLAPPLPKLSAPPVSTPLSQVGPQFSLEISAILESVFLKNLWFSLAKVCLVGGNQMNVCVLFCFVKVENFR